MNVAEIKAALDKAGIDYPAGARKAELEQLLAAGPGATPETDDAGGGDNQREEIPADVTSPASRSAADKQNEATIARIDEKIRRLKVRRDQLTRRQAREKSGANAAGGNVAHRTRKGRPVK